MRKCVYLWGQVFTVFFLFSFHLNIQAQSRLEAHLEAEQAFKNLHFFAEGRGMMLSPGLISAYDLFVPGLGLINKENFSKRWGLVFNDEGQISGLHNVEYKGHHVGVMGCVVCHSGRAAGQFIIGLGNKNVDVYQLGVDVHRIESYWKWFIPGFFKDQTYVDMEEAALAFSKYLANENLGNLTQGLVPISFIRGWFYRIQNIPVPQDMHKGQVKVPFLWGYGEKRKVGQFCDGFGDGEEVGWAVAVELAAGQTPEAVRSYYPKVEHAEEGLSDLLPPPYPFEIDAALAQQGKHVFEFTCANCHGTYEKDAEGFPVYKAPIWIPWEEVRTDRDRVAGHSEDFNHLVNINPLGHILRYKIAQHGYFAPRLEGVWSRFPYLHNGSVPTLADLLLPEAQRPRLFSLQDAGERHRFDPVRIGLTLPDSEREVNELKRRLRRGYRDIYTVEKIGHSNLGHNFHTDLPASDKRALLEYLKTL